MADWKIKFAEKKTKTKQNTQISLVLVTVANADFGDLKVVSLSIIPSNMLYLLGKSKQNHMIRTHNSQNSELFDRN